MKFIIIGLGNFGASLGSKLVELGHEVIGVDASMDRVERWKNKITHTIALDASNPEALQALPVTDVDAVIIAIGEQEGTIIMVAALLKQAGVKRIICRVVSPLQKTILETMNLHEFVYPEESSAARLAYRLDIKGVIDSHKINETHQILETYVPGRLVGTKVSDIDITKYDITLVSVTRMIEEKNILGNKSRTRKTVLTPSPELEFLDRDTLILFGEVTNLETFLES